MLRCGTYYEQQSVSSVFHGILVRLLLMEPFNTIGWIYIMQHHIPGSCLANAFSGAKSMAIIDFHNKLTNAVKQIESLQKTVESMEERLQKAQITAEKFQKMYYAPGNPGFYETQKHFGELKLEIQEKND